MPISVVQACTFYTYYSGTDCSGYGTYDFRYNGTLTPGSIVKLSSGFCVQNWVVDSNYTTVDVVEEYLDCAGCNVLCYNYEFTTFGYGSWTDCNGTNRYEYLNSGDIVCAQNNTPDFNFVPLYTQCVQP